MPNKGYESCDAVCELHIKSQYSVSVAIIIGKGRWRRVEKIKNRKKASIKIKKTQYVLLLFLA